MRPMLLARPAAARSARRRRARRRSTSVVAGLDAAPVERLVAERLDVEHAARRRSSSTKPTMPLERGAHLGAGSVAGRRPRRGHDRGRELLDEPVVDGDDQRVEVVEALVEVAGVEPGARWHTRPHGRRRPALGAEQLEGGVEQQGRGARPGGRRQGSPAQRLGRAAVSRGWQRALPYLGCWKRRCQDVGIGESEGTRGRASRWWWSAAGSAAWPRRSRSAGRPRGDRARARPAARRPPTPRRPSPPSGAAPRRCTRPTASSPASWWSCASASPTCSTPCSPSACTTMPDDRRPRRAAAGRRGPRGAHRAAHDLRVGAAPRRGRPSRASTSAPTRRVAGAHRPTPPTDGLAGRHRRPARRRHDQLDADLVVASTGRRGDVPGWLGGASASTCPRRSTRAGSCTSPAGTGCRRDVRRVDSTRSSAATSAS